MNTQDPNQPPTQTTAIVVAPKREIREVQDDSPISYLMDTAKFEHCYRIAGAMAMASLIPKHLKGETQEQTKANCFLVVNQALRWQLDPFAVAPETYEVGGKLAFQGKLVAAVINARGNLVEKLSYTFNDGKGDALEVTVSGRINGEDKARTITVSVGQAKTSNQMWTKDPQQKLIYTGAIKWARRHKPEVVLGVLTDDDADAIKEEARFMAATPVKSPDFGNALQLTAPPPAHKKRGAKAAESATNPPPPNEPPKAEPTANPELEKVQAGLLKHNIMEAQCVLYLNTSAKVDGAPDYKTLEEVPQDRLKRLAGLLALDKHPMIDQIKEATEGV